MPSDKLRHRLVSEQEADTWPGSYVGHPIAFVEAQGPRSGEWAYGVVSSYRMLAETPVIDILQGADAVLIKMDDPLRLIKIDHLNYALQVGAGMNVAALNALELLDMQNAACTACKKRRGSVPPSVVAMLTAPFDADAILPLYRPSTMELVSVRKQHIVNVVTQSGKKRSGTIYDDPERQAPMCSDLEDIQRQNRKLGKRRRHDSDSSSSDSDQSDQPVVPSARAVRSAFRPSATATTAHARIVNCAHKGKQPESLLQLTRHLAHVVLFLATPPVLRGLFEFGFDTYGLDLMHCKSVTKPDKLAAKVKGVNMTDYSEKNQIRAAPDPTGRGDVTDALRTLTTFAQYFYNPATIAVINAASAFVAKYSAIRDNDAAGWTVIAHWIAEKFGTYSSLLICGETAAAVLVQHKFNRYDEGLAQFNDLRAALRSNPPAGGAAPRSRPVEDTPRHRRGELVESIFGSEFAVRARVPGTPASSMCLAQQHVHHARDVLPGTPLFTRGHLSLIMRGHLSLITRGHLSLAYTVINVVVIMVIITMVARLTVDASAVVWILSFHTSHIRGPPSAPRSSCIAQQV